MPKYSKSYERDECRKMWRGFWHSCFSLLFCCLPGVGLLLAVSGFARQVVRITEKYRVRQIIFVIFASLTLALNIGVLSFEVYQYTRNPNIINELSQWAWHALTGEEVLPGQVAGTDYTGYDDPGLGTMDGFDLPEDEFYTDDQSYSDGNADFEDDYDVIDGDSDDSLYEGDMPAEDWYSEDETTSDADTEPFVDGENYDGDSDAEQADPSLVREFMTNKESLMMP